MSKAEKVSYENILNFKKEDKQLMEDSKIKIDKMIDELIKTILNEKKSISETINSDTIYNRFGYVIIDNIYRKIFNNFPWREANLIKYDILLEENVINGRKKYIKKIKKATEGHFINKGFDKIKVYLNLYGTHTDVKIIGYIYPPNGLYKLGVYEYCKKKIKFFF